MPIPDALMIAVSGFLVVFLMLCLLWMIIEVINRVVKAIESRAKTLGPEGEVMEIRGSLEAFRPEPAHVYGGEIALYDVDEKTAACIMAIISDETKIPLDQLIFKSIRAL